MVDIGIATKALSAIMGIYQKNWIIWGATIIGLKRAKSQKKLNYQIVENMKISKYQIWFFIELWKVENYKCFEYKI
jgi:hypothetical protein